MTADRIAETSIQAYRKKIEDGSIDTDRAKVFQLIDEKGPITMKALEPFMGKKKHKFSGRVRELKDAGMVKKIGTLDSHQVLEVDSRYVSAEEVSVNDLEEPDDLIIEENERQEEVLWTA